MVEGVRWDSGGVEEDCGFESRIPGEGGRKRQKETERERDRNTEKGVYVCVITKGYVARTNVWPGQGRALLFLWSAWPTCSSAWHQLTLHICTTHTHTHTHTHTRAHVKQNHTAPVVVCWKG